MRGNNIGKRVFIKIILASALLSFNRLDWFKIGPGMWKNKVE